MDTESFTVHVKIEGIYRDIAEDLETRFDTSNSELGRLLPKGKNKELTELMKHELGGQIMKEFVGLRAKAYSHLSNNSDQDKRTKRTKNVT